MLTIHIRINDTATQKPTPVRLSVTGPAGEYFPPLGRPATFACGSGEDVGANLRLGRENFAYIDGACEIKLPAGVPLRVRATKGPEFRSLDETVKLGAGQMALRFGIDRWMHLAEAGWISGDSRSHFVPPHAAALEAAAEDVGIVNLLAKVHQQLMNDGNAYSTLTNMTAFSGQSPALEASPQSVVVNTFNMHPALGSLSLLHAHRVVFPLAFGEPFDTDDWSLMDWCDQCHRKKGLVVWANAFHASEGLLGGEALVAAVLGKIDALEFDAAPRPQSLLPWYYRLLNAGVRLPLVAGSAKESNRTPLGAMRTYAHAWTEPSGYTAWIEAVRRGESFITNGPIMSFGASATGFSATAACASTFDKLEVIAGGQVIAVAKPEDEDGRFKASIDLAFPATANWLAARCVGGPSMLNPATVNFAHTSPIYLGPVRRDPAAASVLAECVTKVREWAETQGQYREEKWRTQLVENCEKAVQTLSAG